MFAGYLLFRHINHQDPLRVGWSKPCFSCRYFQAGGSPEHVIQLLSENYSAVAQTVNLLAEWLIQMGRWQITRCSNFFWSQSHHSFSSDELPLLFDDLSLICNFFMLTAGVEPAQVQERVENHLKSLLIKHFDPQKADSIFTVEGEVTFLWCSVAVLHSDHRSQTFCAKGFSCQGYILRSRYETDRCSLLCLQTPAWLEQMIAHTTWRDLFYKLAEAHPDCLMLNFTVKVQQWWKQEFSSWPRGNVTLLSLRVGGRDFSHIHAISFNLFKVKNNSSKSYLSYSPYLKQFLNWK